MLNKTTGSRRTPAGLRNLINQTGGSNDFISPPLIMKNGQSQFLEVRREKNISNYIVFSQFIGWSVGRFGLQRTQGVFKRTPVGFSGHLFNFLFMSTNSQITWVATLLLKNEVSTEFICNLKYIHLATKLKIILY